jgi:hypothetical protein
MKTTGSTKSRELPQRLGIEERMLVGEKIAAAVERAMM